MQSKRTFRILIALILGFTITAGRAPAAAPIDKAKIDSSLRGFIDSGALVGVSAQIYQDGRDAYFGAFGRAVLRKYWMTRLITYQITVVTHCGMIE